MKRMKQGLIAATAVACMAGAPGLAQAATNAAIDAAIVSGLANLAGEQQGDGSWDYGGYNEAATGAVVGAFVSQESHWGTHAAAYQTIVDNAMNYLLNNATTSTVTSPRSDGLNPCGSGSSCTGVYWYGNGESTYTTGLVASAIGQYAASNPSAIATTTGPLAGMSWTQIAQGVTNEYVASQATVVDQTYAGARGGWRYYIPGNGDADSSTTQWAVLSMIYDKSLGATTPGFVTAELAHWLAFAQAGDGSGCYQGPASGLCDHSDTGSLLIGHKFVGTSTSDSAVQSALAWLNANWKTSANGTWYGNFGNPYAMWADYKALELTVGLNDTSAITNLLGCGTLDAGTTCNWWQDYNQWLVSNQNTDGSWDGYAYWTGPLATAFDVSILGGTIIPPPCTDCPEPASLSLMGAGVLGLGLLRRRRQNA